MFACTSTILPVQATMSYAPPAHQGDLNLACGLYAIVNLVCVIVNISDRQRQDVYALIVEALPASLCKDLLLIGTGDKAMEAMLTYMSAVMLKKVSRTRKLMILDVANPTP